MARSFWVGPVLKYQNEIKMIPRRIFPSEHVQELDDSSVLCKYMPFEPGFRSLVEQQSLYLSSLERFQDSDPLEGVTSLAEREATSKSEVQRWYESNKRTTFVTCFVIGDTELDYMWDHYAGGLKDGVMLKTTVGRLKTELSSPPYSGPSQILDIKANPCDGFTVGVVDYFDDAGIDRHEEMRRGLSNIRHVFRKRRAPFEIEKEYRVALRTGATTSNSAFDANADSCLVKVNVANLITEIRLKPGANPEYREKVEALLFTNDLDSIPLLHSSISF